MNAQAAIDVPKLKRMRNVYLYVSALVLLVLGLIYAWSIFATPLAAIYGWDMQDVKVTFTISIIGFSVGQVLGAPLLRKAKIKLTVFTAAVLVACGFAGTALFVSKGIWALYLFYGVFGGLGCGVGYITLVTSITLWFPDRTGYASGVTMMGFGLGSLVLGTIAANIIDAMGISPAFFAIAGFAAVVMILLTLLIKHPTTEEIDALAANKKENSKTSVASTEGTMAGKKPLMTAVFYMIFIFLSCTSVFGLSILGTCKQGALALGVSAGFSTTLVGLVSVINGLSRMLIGALCDRYGQVKCLFLIAIIFILTAVFFLIAFGTGQALFYLLACFIGPIAFGGSPVMGSTFTRTTYGAATYTKNLSILNLNLIVGALIQQIVSSATGGSWIAIYIAVLIAGFIALAMAALYAVALKKQAAEKTNQS